jgi:hypothetical protein
MAAVPPASPRPSQPGAVLADNGVSDAAEPDDRVVHRRKSDERPDKGLELTREPRFGPGARRRGTPRARPSASTGRSQLIHGYSSAGALGASLGVLLVGMVFFGFNLTQWGEWEGGFVGIAGTIAGIAGAVGGLSIARRAERRTTK